jgi:hypothetical protein
MEENEGGMLGTQADRAPTCSDGLEGVTELLGCAPTGTEPYTSVLTKLSKETCFYTSYRGRTDLLH